MELTASKPRIRLAEEVVMIRFRMVGGGLKSGCVAVFGLVIDSSREGFNGIDR